VKDWHAALVGPDTTILQALDVIDRAALRVAFVVDAERVLLGTLTDGDVRRGLLGAVKLDAPVSSIMNDKPVIAEPFETADTIRALMVSLSIHQIPLVDDRRRLIDVVVLEDLLQEPPTDQKVVLMVGGLGLRLRPLTETTPKPMLEVGGKPVLQITIERLIGQGFKNFTLCVNYLASRIEDHFGDGSEFGASIDYVREADPLGTAGALRLLAAPPASPFIVMNGDILTTLNFRELLNFQVEHSAAATMAVRPYEMQIPFGVVTNDGPRVVSFSEKPIQSFFVNAGIYALDPSALNALPESGPCDMPTLFQRVSESGGTTVVFPLREYWLDVGRHDDIARANRDYLDVFSR
jgi:dTDP-glucose pyrophosphorylase